MVVISGKYKGRIINTLPGMKTRPTSARVKEDMFNMLNNYFLFENKTSLDLFGGSGALSLEGLSQGIKKAYINDQSHLALDVIKKNLHGLDQKNYLLFQEDYEVLMKNLSSRAISFDLIYLDPPFAHLEYYYTFFSLLLKLNLLNNWGVVLVESPEILDLMKVEGLVLLKEKHYETKIEKHVYIFRKEIEEGDD